MWSKLWTLSGRLLVVCLSLMLAVPAASAIEVPEEFKEVRIEIDSPDVSELLTMDAETLDRVLYPTGMALPTKYLDFFVFCEYGQTMEVREDVVAFLTYYWPLESGEHYTYAEVRSAQMYLYLNTLLTNSNAIGSFEAEWLSYWVLQELGDAASSADILSQSFRITDVEKLRGYLLQYQQVLQYPAGEQDRNVMLEYYELVEPRDDGTMFAVSENFDWYRGSDGLDTGGWSSMLCDWFKGRYQYLEACGIGVVSGGQGYAVDVALKSYFEGTETTPGIVVPVEPSVPVEDPLITDPPVAGIPVEPSGDGLLDYEEVEPNKYIDDTIKQIPVENIPEKTYNLKDIMLVVALVLVVAVIFVLGILDFIRKRQDPLRKYKRWL